jgi:hypothetical protein
VKEDLLGSGIDVIKALQKEVPLILSASDVRIINSLIQSLRDLAKENRQARTVEEVLRE